MKIKYTPYQRIITLYTVSGKEFEISVSPAKDDNLFCNIALEHSAHHLIAVDTGFFAQLLSQGTQEFTHKTPDLEESLTFKRNGTIWKVLATWGDSAVTCELHHKDVVALSNHFAASQRLLTKLYKKSNPSRVDKLKVIGKTIFSLPTKIFKL